MCCLGQQVTHSPSKERVFFLKSVHQLQILTSTYDIYITDTYTAIPCMLYLLEKIHGKLPPQTCLFVETTAASRTHWETRGIGPAVAAPENLQPWFFQLNFQAMQTEQIFTPAPRFFDDSLCIVIVVCHHAIIASVFCHHVIMFITSSLTFVLSITHILAPLTPLAIMGRNLFERAPIPKA